MNYLETLKNIAKDKEKRTENLILLVVILVILLVSFNYIFNTESKEKSNNTSLSENINSNSISSQTTQEVNLESKIANILSQISGIDNVSVVITYASQSTTTPVYNIKEEEKTGEKTVEKSVAYNEENGSKTAIIESVELPQVEGAIVVANGASSVDIRSKIATAVATVTGIPAYKVQVFERQS